MGKEITLKNIEIINATNSIGELMQERLPVKVGWNVTKNMKKIEVAFKNYADFELELIKKYAIKDENGNLKADENNKPKFAPNNKEKYLKEQNELLDLTDTIDILPIKLSDLDGINLKAATLFNLEFMIEDDE